MPDDDDLADKYLIADERLAAAGLRWYEVSNWSRDEASQCRHNVLYWTGADWWGVGPGAHSHVGGTRFWNAKHPAAYGRKLAAGGTPAAGREVLDAADQYVERVLLEVRLSRGIALGDLAPYGRDKVPGLVADGLVEVVDGRMVLTLRGRLLADAVVRALLED